MPDRVPHGGEQDVPQADHEVLDVGFGVVQGVANRGVHFLKSYGRSPHRVLHHVEDARVLLGLSPLINLSPVRIDLAFVLRGRSVRPIRMTLSSVTWISSSFRSAMVTPLGIGVSLIV